MPLPNGRLAHFYHSGKRLADETEVVLAVLEGAPAQPTTLAHVMQPSLPVAAALYQRILGRPSVAMPPPYRCVPEPPPSPHGHTLAVQPHRYYRPPLSHCPTYRIARRNVAEGPLQPRGWDLGALKGEPLTRETASKTDGKTILYRPMNGDFFSSLVFATVAHSALISLAVPGLRSRI